MVALREAVADATALVEVLDCFLEAARGVAKRRALKPIERKLEKALQKAFRKQGRAFLNKFEGVQHRFTEALHDNDWEWLFDAAAEETFDLFWKPVNASVTAALAAGAKQAIADIGMELRFDLANPRAVAYVEQRGATLVAAQQTTKDYIRTVIRQGVDEGWSYNRMAERISERYEEFAVGRPQRHIDSRAHGIAVTEAGNAYVEANAIVARDLQDAGIAMEKHWSTMGDGNVDPECEANEAAGWITFDEPFPSGHMQPLAHPYCRCDLMVRRARGEASATSQLEQAAQGTSEREVGVVERLGRLGSRDVALMGETPAECLAGWPQAVTQQSVVTGERRQHYLDRHPDMLEHEALLEQVLHDPDEVHFNTTDSQMAILYRRLDEKHYMRAALWISDETDKMNSVHSYRKAAEKEVLKGREKGRVAWRRQ